MPASTTAATSTDAELLSRLIRPEQDDLSKEAAQALLRLQFGAADLERLHELVVRNQNDELTAAERSDLESYLRVSSFLDLMHAKARRSLKNHD
jgi:hypothetical protein